MYEYHEITILLIFNQIFKSYIHDTRLKSYCIVDDTAIMSNYIFSKFEILHIFFNYTYMSCQFLDFWTKCKSANRTDFFLAGNHSTQMD